MAKVNQAIAEKIRQRISSPPGRGAEKDDPVPETRHPERIEGIALIMLRTRNPDGSSCDAALAKLRADLDEMKRWQDEGRAHTARIRELDRALRP